MMILMIQNTDTYVSVYIQLVLQEGGGMCKGRFLICGKYSDIPLHLHIKCPNFSKRTCSESC